MSKTLIPFVVLFSMVAIIEAVALAVPRQAVAPGDEGALQRTVNKAMKLRRFAASLPFPGMASDTLFNAIGSGATDLRIPLGQSMDGLGTALGGLTGVKVNVAVLANDATSLDGLANAAGAAVGGSVKLLPDGLTGVKVNVVGPGNEATGLAFGGLANAVGAAVGGSAGIVPDGLTGVKVNVVGLGNDSASLGSVANAVGAAVGGSVKIVPDGFTGVQVNVVGLGTGATGLATGDLANAVGAAVGGSVGIVLDGHNGGKTVGDVFSNGATAIGDAFGGDRGGARGNTATPQRALVSSATRVAMPMPSKVVWLLAAWLAFSCFLPSGA